MTHLQKERLVLAIGAVAAIDMILSMTIKYAKERYVFDKPLSSFQNTQFELAEIINLQNTRDTARTTR